MTDPASSSFTKLVRRDVGSSLIFLAEQLCGLVCPERPEPQYKLTLNKTPTQEEFIRGRMTENPYDSQAIGAETMRDVKNFVCASLDMLGLCDDDYGMELLVAGQIIKLDLPVTAVYVDASVKVEEWKKVERAATWLGLTLELVDGLADRLERELEQRSGSRVAWMGW